MSRTTPAPPRPTSRPLSRLTVGLLGLLTASAHLPAPASAQEDERGDPPEALYADMSFRFVGPARGGRVTAVAGHPSHPSTYYMGATGGGVWKTTDRGHTWHNVSDGHFATGSIGSIRVAPSDPTIVYVGTGSEGLRSNVITGRGAYRSDDGGETWRFVGLRDAGQIGAVEVHREDPDRVYAAALGHPFGRNEERGVYRSLNGGESWERILFVSDSVGAVDLELHPTRPEVIYAALWRAERKPWTIISGAGPESGNGIWRSEDGGDTWEHLRTGLPDGLTGKIDLAVSRAMPDRAYALVEAPDPEEGLYRSDDAGDTWELVSDRDGLMDRPFYFTNVTADPTDADVVYVGSVRFWRSEDGGRTFERRSTPHVDNHDLWINPEDPSLMVQGNDGGANVSLDGGETWSTQFNQPTAELYQVDVDDRFPYWLYAGQQDNYTAIAVPSLPASPPVATDDGWFEPVGGCETGPAVPKPGHPDMVFTNCKGRFGVWDRRTGQERQYWVGAVYMYGHNPADLPYRFQRVVPIEVSPHDPDVVYHASQHVHRTRDGGVTWETISPDLTAFRPERQVVSGAPITRDVTGEEHYSTLYALAASPHDRGVIWAGANDGPVHVTRDGGRSWEEVTPPDMPPEGRINAIAVSPHRPGKAYVAGYRYLLDDWAPYLYRTEDGGRTWTRLTDGTNGIPEDHPVRAVAEDPYREGLLYAGTEFGLFVSFDDGRRWRPLELGLPVTPITDLKVVGKDLVVSTMGRGFWILDNLSPLHQARAALADAPVHLFQPEDAVAHRAGGFSFGPRAPHEPEYSPPGAVIDYWLGGEGPHAELRLEILDDRGRVLRTFVPEVMEDGAADGAEPGLPAEPGHHRFRWDLRHPGAWTSSGRRSGGPRVAPGEYAVRLSIGDWSATRHFRVHADPRLEAVGVTTANLMEQQDLALRIRDAISDGRRAAARMEELLDEAPAEGEAVGGAEGGDVPLESLRALHASLVTASEGSYPQPMLLDQLGYLYGMVTRADQKVGRDAFSRYDELHARLDALLEEMERLVGGEATATR